MSTFLRLRGRIAFLTAEYRSNVSTGEEGKLRERGREEEGRNPQTCTLVLVCVLNLLICSVMKERRNLYVHTRTLTHKLTHLHSPVNPVREGKHKTAVDTLDRKQRKCILMTHKDEEGKERDGEGQENLPTHSFITGRQSRHRPQSGPITHRARDVDPPGICQSRWRPLTEAAVHNWRKSKWRKRGECVLVWDVRLFVDVSVCALQYCICVRAHPLCKEVAF